MASMMMVETLSGIVSVELLGMMEACGYSNMYRDDEASLSALDMGVPL
jgi:hypothetical protein